MNGFDTAFLDDTPLPTKFRPQKLRSAFRAIDSIRRINFQAGMRSYMAEQNLKTASAKSSRTNIFSSSSSSSVCSPRTEGGANSPVSFRVCTPRPPPPTLQPHENKQPGLSVRSLPASRAVSSCDLFQQMLCRSKSNENLLNEKDKNALEKQFAEIQQQLNTALGHSRTAENEWRTLQMEIDNVKSKFKNQTKFLSLVVKALDGAVQKIPRRSISTKGSEGEPEADTDFQESGDEAEANLHGSHSVASVVPVVSSNSNPIVAS